MIMTKNSRNSRELINYKNMRKGKWGNNGRTRFLANDRKKNIFGPNYDS